VNARTLLASAALLSAVLVTPLLIEAQAPIDVDPTERVRSVTVRNECPETVWIFYGRHRPLQSQDMLTLGPYMQTSEPVLPGDMLWLLDLDARELDRAIFQTDVTAITVLPSCVRLQVTRNEPLR
jgi:hypothetical protein